MMQIGKIEIVCNQEVFKEGGKGLRILSIILLIAVMILNLLIFFGEGKIEWFELLCAIVFYMFAKNRSASYWANVPVEIGMRSDGKLYVLNKDAIHKGHKIISRRNTFDTYKIDISEDEHFIYLNIIGSGIAEHICDDKVINTTPFEKSAIPFRVLPEYTIVKELKAFKEVSA